jgi:hypothetical protein
MINTMRRRCEVRNKQKINAKLFVLFLETSKLMLNLWGIAAESEAMQLDLDTRFKYSWFHSSKME